MCSICLGQLRGRGARELWWLGCETGGVVPAASCSQCSQFFAHAARTAPCLGLRACLCAHRDPRKEPSIQDHRPSIDNLLELSIPLSFPLVLAGAAFRSSDLRSAAAADGASQVAWSDVAVVVCVCVCASPLACPPAACPPPSCKPALRSERCSAESRSTAAAAAVAPRHTRGNSAERR